MIKTIVTVKTFTLLQKVFLSLKNKKMYHRFHKNIKQHSRCQH